MADRRAAPKADAENEEGLFLSYKRLCRVTADMIAAIDPQYRYPLALVSTVMVMVMVSSHMQKYFAEHLPRLTEVRHDKADESTTAFLTDLVFRAIAVKSKRVRAELPFERNGCTMATRSSCVDHPGQSRTHRTTSSGRTV